MCIWRPIVQICRKATKDLQYASEDTPLANQARDQLSLLRREIDLAMESSPDRLPYVEISRMADKLTWTLHLLHMERADENSRVVAGVYVRTLPEYQEFEKILAVYPEEQSSIQAIYTEGEYYG